jgi:hypothetical protein
MNWKRDRGGGLSVYRCIRVVPEREFPQVQCPTTSAIFKSVHTVQSRLIIFITTNY